MNARIRLALALVFTLSGCGRITSSVALPSVSAFWIKPTKLASSALGKPLRSGSIEAMDEAAPIGVGDGLLIGVHGVAGSIELSGPSFVPSENIGADRPIRSATIRPDAYADVLLRGEPSGTAQRLALSFRGCD